MKKAFLLPLLLLLPAVQASEADMRKILAKWDQQVAEYEEALEVAGTPELQATVIPPRTDAIAKQLWKSISAKTGTRKVRVRKETRTVSTYEFESPWAAPAVAWFLCHPNEFALALSDTPRQQAFFAQALMDSVERVHYSNSAIEPACAALVRGSTKKSYDILEKILNGNPDPGTKASAALAMSILLGDPLIASAVGNQTEVRHKRILYLKQAATLAPEGARFGSVAFEDAVGEATYVLRYLSEGTVPPQITLTDTAGQAVTLPLPGKPHLLYFWAPTNAEAFAAVRHMAAAMTNYPDLVICPITGHQNPATWPQTLERNSISTCYMDDEQGTAAQAYRITSAPTAVLLDERCHILYIGAPGLKLQTAIYALAQKKGAKPAQKDTSAQETPDQKQDTPTLQPKAKETKPGQDDAPPALREMPEF